MKRIVNAGWWWQGGLGMCVAGWLGVLMLAGCQPAERQQAGAVDKHPTVAADSSPVAPDSAQPVARVPAAPVLADSALVKLVRLPGAPRYEVPQVVLANARAARRVNQVLLRELITGLLDDTMAAASPARAIRRAAAEYQANGQTGTFSTSYAVLLNRAGLLSLALYTGYNGAYPSTATCHATFDAQTGRRLAVSDLVADTLALRQRWHHLVGARVQANRREVVRGNDPSDLALVDECTHWNDSTRSFRPGTTPRLHDFALTRQGLVLFTDFDFPHAILNLSPESDYRFAYASLRLRPRAQQLRP